MPPATAPAPSRVPTVRARLKDAAERLALGGGLARASRARMGGAALVLAYHDVAPDGAAPAGDRSLHLPVSAFAAQLDRLAETHDVVPLPALLHPPRTDRPRAAITFDDAYRGAATLGVAALAARGLPATLFVVPGRVGGDAFWWDALAGDGGMPADVRARALDEARGREDRVLALAAAAGMERGDVPPFARPAGEDELRAAASVPGITLGAHTWSHPALPRLPEAEARREVRDALAWLRARFPASTVPWLSYPYGLWSPAVARIAEEEGCRAALRIRGGWMRPGADPMAIPRVNVPAGLSLRGFTLRAAGLLCR